MSSSNRALWSARSFSCTMACIARSVIAERRTMCGEGENVLLDRVREVEQAHHLRHPGAGDPIPAGGVGLVGDLAGLEEDLPFDGLAQELDHAGCPGSFGGLGLHRGVRMAEITRSAGTRHVKRNTLPVSKGPVGLRAISTFCSRCPPWLRRRPARVATGAPFMTSTATLTMRNQTSGSATLAWPLGEPLVDQYIQSSLIYHRAFAEQVFPALRPN
jgi:hypothetical protein